MSSDVAKIFDIVIPVGPNDVSLIKKQMEYTTKNVIGYRNIYLIYRDNSLQIEGCTTIPETIFPFSLQTVTDYHGLSDRNGWYLQQLLKLYAGLIIPDILDKYLVIDADTFFLKPTIFYQDGKCLYNYGTEFHMPYFIHMMHLHPSFHKMDQEKSGICHHMMFETKYVREIFSLVQNLYGHPFHDVFLAKVTEWYDSGASEYELYFNYMLSQHPDAITIRKLERADVTELIFDSKYDYISYHWYMR